MNKKTIGFLCQWVDDCVFHHISSETNAQTLWKKMPSLCELLKIRYF